MSNCQYCGEEVERSYTGNPGKVKFTCWTCRKQRRNVYANKWGKEHNKSK